MRSRRVLALLACSLLLGLTPLAADSVIQRGTDVFTTMGGKTYYDFAEVPIPAGFFCKGSKPFTGRVAFKGLPLATETPGQLQGGDTVIERLDDAVFDAKGVATTRIRFRALSMVSIEPVKTRCGAFHAYVSLAGRQRVTTMKIRRTEEGGGTFAAPLAVDVRLTFVPVKPPRNGKARKLELTGSFTFPANPVPWSYGTEAMAKRVTAGVIDTNGDQTPDTLVPGTSNFVAGWTPGAQNKACCREWVCHAESSGKEHCYWQPPPPECWNMPCTIDMY
ncbi:MAG TPA: hypothetical protein VEL74_23250 [Thermoanaerobaculia bacterium]|nr:hypothetical protein [Thermoanaerobaculia bacterium]